jgi:hypothetical protein
MVFVGLYIDFEYTKMQENAMYFDEVQDVTIFLKSKKTLMASFSVLYKFVFKIDGFLGL